MDYPEHRHEHEQQREKGYDEQPIVRRDDDVSVVIGEDYRSGRRRRGADEAQAPCRQKPPASLDRLGSLVTVAYS